MIKSNVRRDRGCRSHSTSIFPLFHCVYGSWSILINLHGSPCLRFTPICITFSIHSLIHWNRPLWLLPLMYPRAKLNEYLNISQQLGRHHGFFWPRILSTFHLSVYTAEQWSCLGYHNSIHRDSQLYWFTYQASQAPISRQNTIFNASAQQICVRGEASI